MIEADAVAERQPVDRPLVLRVDAEIQPLLAPSSIRRRALGQLVRHAVQEPVGQVRDVVVHVGRRASPCTL